MTHPDVAVERWLGGSQDRSIARCSLIVPHGRNLSCGLRNRLADEARGWAAGEGGDTPVRFELLRAGTDSELYALEREDFIAAVRLLPALAVDELG